MTDITEEQVKELRAAMPALQQWFASQEISLAHATIMCNMFIAISLVNKTKDVVVLQKAIKTYQELLILDVVGELKGFNR